MRPLVVIVQRIMPHYRIPFFQGLYERLNGEGIELRVVYGQERPGTVPVSVRCEADWAIQVRNRYVHVRDKELVWQPVIKQISGSQLVILEQANRLAFNYVILAARRFAGFRVAFWGHGKNLQAKTDETLEEWFKRWCSKRVDWWFVYTQLSADIVRSYGVEKSRITIVENSIATTDLCNARARYSSSDVDALRSSLGLESANVCIYCGGMYSEKCIDFVLEACDRIRLLVPDFHIIFVGHGPDEKKVRDFAASRPWAKLIGPVYGVETVPYFLVSRLLLMPGLVGLAVIDSFVHEVPIVTTDVPFHSPEIAYLKSGQNGLMTRHDIEDYAVAVASYLMNGEGLERLKRGCRQSSKRYTITNMIDRFVDGIRKCLLT